MVRKRVDFKVIWYKRNKRVVANLSSRLVELRVKIENATF